MPALPLVDKVTKEFMKLKKDGIPLYVIGGSHDYSHLGNSFISLLESAHVFEDVGKWKVKDKGTVELQFTQAPKNTQITGILGKKKGLDKNIYQNLDKHILDKTKFNIFMFHTTLNDFKPDFMQAVKVDVDSTYLPSGFDYYAGGHVHTFIDGNYSLLS